MNACLNIPFRFSVMNVSGENSDDDFLLDQKQNFCELQLAHSEGLRKWQDLYQKGYHEGITEYERLSPKVDGKKALQKTFRAALSKKL